MLVLDRFEAAFDNVSTTNYKATASSAENRPIAFTWKMQYVAGRCGNFTVYGASNPSDLGNAQQATVPGILNSDGYFVSTAAYNHEGCPFAIEANEVLVLDVVRKVVGTSCQLEYVQKARDDDEPSKPKEFPPTVKTGTCTEETKPPPPPPPLNAAPGVEGPGAPARRGCRDLCQRGAAVAGRSRAGEQGRRCDHARGGGR